MPQPSTRPSDLRHHDEPPSLRRASPARETVPVIGFGVRLIVEQPVKTLVTNLQPFLAALFAVALLSEELTWLQVAGGAAIVGIYLNSVGFMYAIDLTNASTVALIFGALPILTAIFAYVLGVERLHRRFWIAAAISFLGVALVAAGSASGVSGNLVGDLLALLAAATWGFYSVAIVPLLRRYSVWRISAGALVFGAVPLVLTAIPQLLHQRWDLEALVWAAFAFAVLGPLVLTNFLWFTAIERVGPSRATLVTNLQPFLAALFAVALLSEELTWLQVAGGVAIGLALGLARRRPALESA